LDDVLISLDCNLGRNHVVSNGGEDQGSVRDFRVSRDLSEGFLSWYDETKYRAHEVAVKVRSKHFDPDDRQMRLRSVVLSADDHDFTLGPIYVNEADGGRDALFEYFLTVAMADGAEYEAKEWIASDDLRVVIGRSQIEKALGFVPGASPSAPPTPGAPGTDRDEQRDEARGRL